MAAAKDNNSVEKIINKDVDVNTECPICLDNFEEENLKYLDCGCGTRTCIPCAKECLLHSTKDPHCHKCERGWDRSFQYQHFGPTWVNNTYKKYRKNLILEREKSRMPETMPYVIHQEKIDECDARIFELKLQIKQTEPWEGMKRYELKRLQRQLYDQKFDLVTNHVFGNKSSEPAKKFIKACPNDKCRGFLSSAYKCGMCKIFVCPKCFEIKGLNKNDPHTCDENNVKAAELIKKETKPCPKCAVPIFKIVGCSQIWCTQCHVAFSWVTGKIENGVVHNPHFYEWARKNGQNTLNPGTVVCGGLVRYYQYITILNEFDDEDYLYYADNEDYIITTMKRRELDTLHRGARHFNYILDNLRNDMNRNIDNRDIRIRYLRNQIDEKQLVKIATQRDNIREKKLAMLQIMELMNTVIIENFNELVNRLQDIIEDRDVYELSLSVTDVLNTFDNNIENTREYVNSELLKVSKNYKMKVYYIPFNFDVHTFMNSYDELCLLRNIETKFSPIIAKKVFDENIGYIRKYFLGNLQTFIDSQ